MSASRPSVGSQSSHVDDNAADLQPLTSMDLGCAGPNAGIPSPPLLAPGLSACREDIFSSPNSPTPIGIAPDLSDLSTLVSPTPSEAQPTSPSAMAANSSEVWPAVGPQLELMSSPNRSLALMLPWPVKCMHNLVLFICSLWFLVVGNGPPVSPISCNHHLQEDNQRVELSRLRVKLAQAEAEVARLRFAEGLGPPNGATARNTETTGSVRWAAAAAAVQERARLAPAVDIPPLDFPVDQLICIGEHHNSPQSPRTMVILKR